MPDVFTKAKRSQVMSLIRSRGNKETELALAILMRASNISGWRRHIQIQSAGYGVRRFRVRPDFVFPKHRLAVFVDGCFWHGCPKHCNQPANNRAFWLRKLSGNRDRDRLVNRALRRANWRVVRIWECALQKRPESCVRRIQRMLGSRPASH